MRTIDANALKTAVNHAVLDVADTPMPNEYASKLAVKMGELFKKQIDDAPTIDAVEVVRCKDCEEYIPWPEGGYICGRIGSYFGNTKPNDFCSRGVRKMDVEVQDEAANDKK